MHQPPSLATLCALPRRQADDAGDGSGGGGGGGGAVDNPDQRICDDVAAFVRASTDICLSFVKKVINCVAFAGEVDWSTWHVRLWGFLGFSELCPH